MTRRRCACRTPLSESELISAHSGVPTRIPDHDAEPCLLSPVEVIRNQYAAKADPRPVLTRLPRLTVVARP